MTRRTLTALALLVVAACSTTPIVVTPRSFERPGKVAFACFDASGAVQPLDRCTVAADGTFDPDTSMLALVTQTARGEVAAVDLTASRLIDADPRVPGFTFVPVGVLPSDVIVPTMSPSKTYVSNGGESTLSVVSTAAFRAATVPTAADIETVAVPDGAPGALALSPDERTLFVAVPQAGVVLAFAIAADGSLGDAPMRITLGTTVPAGVDAASGSDWGKLCPSDPLERAALAARAPVSLGAAARPSSFVVDADEGHLIVTDAALPIVHVLDLATLTELEPFVVGVPTSEAALTPAVPVSELEGDCTAGATCTRYLYAIDATDGSVLVYDLVEHAVMPVSASDVGARDRIRLGAIARGVAVMSPEYPGTYCADGSDDATLASPVRMRGVFVAIAASDGTLRVIDVHDLDVTCRGGAACSSPPTENDQRVFIRRPRPRIGSFLTAGVSTLGAPSVVLDGQPFPVGNDGVTESTPAPDLSVVTCPTGQRQAYPAVDDSGAGALVCAGFDPWTMVTEAWVATWQGAIPGSQGGRGALGTAPDGTPTLTDPGLRFCAQGVLGSADVPSGAEPESASVGDMLAITATLPDANRERCLPMFPEDAAGLPARILVPIVSAANGSLRLEATVTVDGAPVDWSQVTSCYDELVTFEVRTRGEYTVVGDRTRFLHRVHPSTAVDAHCEVDTTQPRTRIGRARPGEDFVSPFIAFHIAAADFGDSTTTLAFVVGNVPPKLAVDFGSIGSGSRFVGSLPSSVRYNRVDGRLYAIDEAARGLVQLDLSPFTVRRTYE